MSFTPLPTVWTLKAVGDLSHVPEPLRQRLSAGIPATVPGVVHTDLMAAGLIEDPYLADNELRQFWIGRTDFRYETDFELTSEQLAQEHLELVCEGLDTLARLELNGTLIGTAENMHLAYRFSLKPAAKAGRNHLAIAFASPMLEAERLDRDVYPGLPSIGGGSNTPHPHNMLRKMACNMGWDWGPDVTTSGIWRPISVHAWSGVRISYVRPWVLEASPMLARLEVHVDLQGTAKHLSALLRAPSGEIHTPANISHSIIRFEISNPERWWPVGHGPQPLYTLAVTADNDRWQGQIALRTFELDTTPDAEPVREPVPDALGSRMTLKVNGKPVYLKGADWIPDDCFPHRISRERYVHRLTQARDANMNAIRIWGGGIFEQPAFYETCDRLGLLVWHDFLFACGTYPEEQPYRANVEAEVRHNVSRLCHHASIALWNGCNENIWGTFDWGEKWVRLRTEGKRTWGLGYYLEIIPAILRELDPHRPYWPASPYSGTMEIHPNANEHGNRHVWDVWHGKGQYRNYLTHYPRLATEFGYHGPAAYATVAAAIPPEQRTWNSPMMKLHNKNGNPGQEQTNTRMADDFVPPTHNYDDWHYLAQIMQARALAMGVEWFRALHPWNSGAMFWQLNDCYPVSSWSAIDSEGREKPLLHAARNFFAPRLVTIKPRRVIRDLEENYPLAVYLHNDHDDAWQTPVTLRQLSLDGHELARVEHTLTVAPRAVGRFKVPESMCTNPQAFLIATTSESRNFWWFSPDKDLPYPPPRFTAKLLPDGSRDQRYSLAIHAETLLRDLVLQPDRIHPKAHSHGNFVTLLPGERFTFYIDSPEPLSLYALIKPPVLTCANLFGRR